MSNRLSEIVAGDKYLALRAAVLATATLAAWWFGFKKYSLILLWALAYFPMAFFISPPGLEPIVRQPEEHRWSFNVSVNANVKNPASGEMQRIESLELYGEEDNVAFFISGMFVYLALSASAGGFSKARYLETLKGIAVQAVISILSLMLYAYINGHGMVMSGQSDARNFVWWLHWAYHLDYLVVPFAGPFLTALAVHPRWREYVRPAGLPRSN